MFCLLMAVYHKESPTHLAGALDSIANQTVLPSQFVLVKDGLLPEPLNQVIDDYERRLSIEVLALPENVGLARALNKGLQIVREPWVVRFDSDDICTPVRFEEQLRWMASDQYDLFGSQIVEFDEQPTQSVSTRCVPLNDADIKRFANLRNPFNHMTVCFRTDMIKSAGGYPILHGMEDYALWIKLIKSGARLANSKNALVYARVGNGMVARRGGFEYIKSEFKLQSLMISDLNKSLTKAAVHFFSRAFVFSMPKAIRAKIYKVFLRDNHAVINR